jgi:GTP-binding protein Era
LKTRTEAPAARATSAARPAAKGAARPAPGRHAKAQGAPRAQAQGAPRAQAQGAPRSQAQGAPRAQPQGAPAPAAERARPAAPPPPPPQTRRKKPRVVAPSEDATPLDPTPRAGTVALIGRPNVGKSTLLNAALEQPLSIVSPTPQTTRDAILGVVHRGAAEIALLDTPGLHRPRSELGRVMNQTAREAARIADVVVFIIETPVHARKLRDDQVPHVKPHPGDVILLADIGADKPTILVINKIDRSHDKGGILPIMEAYGKLREFAAVVPISALRENGVLHVLDEVAKLLPAQPWQHAADDITDRPIRFFAAEYVREQILRATQAEVPHATAVTIDRFLEPAEGTKGAIHIDATICVERQGQKRILIGTGGEMLKRIGTDARMRIQELTGRKVNLKIWVRVLPAWRQSAAQLEELGYKSPRSGLGGEAVAILELPADDAGDPETSS